LRVAEIVADVCALTPVVATLNTADPWPAGKVTVEGPTADVVLLASDTTNPDGPATPFSVSVPAEVVPPGTSDGLILMLAREAGTTVNPALTDCAPKVADMGAFICESTPAVVTVNVAVVWPEVTVTVDGTVATGLVLDNVMTTPAEAAGPFKVTVPLEGLPPGTDEGFKLIDTS